MDSRASGQAMPQAARSDEHAIATRRPQCPRIGANILRAGSNAAHVGMCSGAFPRGGCLNAHLADETSVESPSPLLPRRGAIASVVIATCNALQHSPRAALAVTGPLPKTCNAYNEAEAAGKRLLAQDTGLGPTAPPTQQQQRLLLPYKDPAGLFKLSYPCGWSQVANLLPEMPILASFYNPEEPGAETLAVYRGSAPEGVRGTSQLGSPQDVAARLANVAPNGAAVDAYDVVHDGLSYIVTHVEFGGNTAGMFGAAREFRAIAVVEGVQYALRVTTTRYRYLAYDIVRQLMKDAVESFEVAR